MFPRFESTVHWKKEFESSNKKCRIGIDLTRGGADLKSSKCFEGRLCSRIIAGAAHGDRDKVRERNPNIGV